MGPRRILAVPGPDDVVGARVEPVQFAKVALSQRFEEADANRRLIENPRIGLSQPEQLECRDVLGFASAPA